MNKFLVTIEFRYSDIDNDGDKSHLSKTVTIGVYETFDEACVNGDKTLELLETRYKIHKFPDGKEAKKERFSKNGGSFGLKKDLVCNLAYLSTPFDFFAKITELKYLSINDTLTELEDAHKRVINNHNKED